MCSQDWVKPRPKPTCFESLIAHLFLVVFFILTLDSRFLFWYWKLSVGNIIRVVNWYGFSRIRYVFFPDFRNWYGKSPSTRKSLQWQAIVTVTFRIGSEVRSRWRVPSVTCINTMSVTSHNPSSYTVHITVDSTHNTFPKCVFFPTLHFPSMGVLELRPTLLRLMQRYFSLVSFFI